MSYFFNQRCNIYYKFQLLRNVVYRNQVTIENSLSLSKPFSRILPIYYCRPYIKGFRRVLFLHSTACIAIAPGNSKGVSICLLFSLHVMTMSFARSSPSLNVKNKSWGKQMHFCNFKACPSGVIH